MTTQLQTKSPRDKWLSVKRGFMGKCPHCGEGRMFRAYLKVSDACPACGEELHHQRADDAPPYMTIFVVGHIIGAGILFMEERDFGVPDWVQGAGWAVITLILCLWLLPHMKGALIGLQWALRMHGFGGNEEAATLPASAPSLT